MNGQKGFFTSGSALTEISLASLQKAKTTGPKTQDGERLQYGSKYLDVYDEVSPKAKTGDELVERVEKYFPGMKAIDFGLHWQARLLFPNSCSDKLTKLPGIFLAPSGEYHGEVART